ncbi:glycosyltransferase family 4 protein [Nocardioides sp.]|uniref:glycosyltransferase family 4 protein n=1 Tax=Nocardioides sp. TaxID=35761 RepID=UPI00199554FA|nr:glycosyltransferase family 4 protein [Nocardioides sp.]MBC7279450.1 glycosyltransferase family 4 protein [Nocardioides sp.]
MVNAAQQRHGVARTHVLIIVQNLPVPLDRRVWLECQALVARGYEVSVICPKGPGDPGRQQLSGVRIYKYRPAPQASGVLGYLLEFVYCWIRTALLANRVWQDRPFSVMQACNPPDTYWLLARIWKRRGVRFVFDQHDLNPELFLSRFGTPTSLSGRAQLAALRWLEKQTYAAADQVISTNESYRKVAIARGGMDPRDVTVVRSGPDTSVMRPVRPHDVASESTAGGRHTLVYLGIMGPQDGVDTVLEVMAELVHRRGRSDVDAVLMGFGDCLEELERRCTELRLDDVVTFTGRAGSALIAQHLSAATVGLCPDLKTPLNDVSTMNKTMEYMAYALPSVSFDLVETRVSAEDAALFVPSGDVAAFTDAVESLLDDPELRVELALRARERAAKVLDWGPQSAAYVQVYDSMCAIAEVTVAVEGFEYVDLDDPDALRQFVLTRGPAVT